MSAYRFPLALVAALTVLGLSPQGPATINTTAGRLANVCVDAEARVDYCNNVGKTAVNWAGVPDALKGLELGKIIGVVWRQKGSLISSDGRTSPRNAYNYVIDDGLGKPFLRQCREIKAK